MAVFEKPIALAPSVGGRSISEATLKRADIIVSTTGALISGGIRVGIASAVSHTALYAGSGTVIEAIGQGVVSRSIYDSLVDDVLAVAYRDTRITSPVATAIIQYASAQIGEDYSVAGALAAADPILCRVIGARPTAFFCSQLVIEAYKQGRRPLTTSPSQCVTPEGVVEIATKHLAYVGHLKGNAAWLPVLWP